MRAYAPVVIVVVVVVASAALGTSVQAQSVVTEVDLTSGYSTEEHTAAVATQLRVFGEIKPKIQFNVEGTWARRSVDITDAFGAAYPYGNRVQLSEAYGERTFTRGAAVTSIRAGQYRTPFGIYSRADYGYSGFLRGPLIRYEGYWAMDNTMLERGMDVVVGTPRLSVEASVGTPGDHAAVFRRRSGLDNVVRAQAYYKALVVGASHINSQTYGPAAYAAGKMVFTGIDARWTLGGIQLRGEWLNGQPWEGPKTRGGYVDAIVHRPFMGPVTLVFRTEQLTYLSKYPFPWHGTNGFLDWQGRRQTMGGRVRLPGGLTAQVNAFRHSSLIAHHDRSAFDMALTYSVRAAAH